MARVGVRVEPETLPDRVTLGVLTRVFPPELVDAVVDEAGAREERRRSLPARLTVYFTLALWLFMASGYDLVLRRLVDGLAYSRAGWGGWSMPSTGSITKARARLGAEPLRLLFTRVAGTAGPREVPGVCWRGLRLVAVDGTCLDVPDTAGNDEAFGRGGNDRKDAAFPQVRLVGLAECGTRSLIDAAFGACTVAETELARRLLPALRPGMLLLADRGFPSWALWREAAATGADLLWRMKASFTLPVIEVLDDGSYLSVLRPPRKKDGAPVTVRVIEYSVRGEDGTSEVFCLATTLLDPAAAPAAELAGCYHQRWQAETAFAALKTTIRGGPGIVLRSKSPDGVTQEIWALLCVYQALHELITDAAARGRVPATRISFIHALEAARRTAGAALSPRTN